MRTGELIGSGLDADVYAIDESWVLRRTRDRRSQHREAAVMAHLHAHGYPVPEIRPSDNAEDLVMRRAAGPTLLEAAFAGDLDTDRVGAILAELLVRLHAVPVQDEKDEKHREDREEGKDGQTGNGDQPGGPATAILHLDLHPMNVILTADGPVVIDWTNTRQDQPNLDWAMSALILAQVALNGSDLSPAADDLLTALLAHRPPAVVLDAAVMARAHAQRADNPHDVHDHLDEAVALVIARAG
ncbi:MAG: aminoglycoside phosphotransferase family protein [Catenulispora sp.]|nr:aminoglycoside phosphotransferase family protein [Catenulispora sp.]